MRLFCLRHENGPGPFLQPAPCLASSVEGAGELSQEERVLLPDSVPCCGPGLCSAQQPAAPGGRNLPPRTLGHILSWVPPVRHFPWAAPQTPQRMDLGQVAPVLHTAAFLVPSEPELHPLQQGLYLNLGRRRMVLGLSPYSRISAYRVIGAPYICYSCRVLFTSY